MIYSLQKKLIFVFFTLFIINNHVIANEQVQVNSIQALELILAEHKGDVIYLDFWASWCVPCRKSFPWMNAIQKKYQSQRFTVISVNVDANDELAQKFLKKTPASFAVIYDPKGKDRKSVV